MATLEDVKQVNEGDKRVIDGYIYEMQSILSTDNKIHYIIPKLVIHWILLYYSIIEQFNPNMHSSTFTLFFSLEM